MSTMIRRQMIIQREKLTMRLCHREKVDWSECSQEIHLKRGRWQVNVDF